MPPLAGFRRQFVWTVLPSGRLEPAGQQRALFSVLLTPRLIGPQGTSPTVGQFGMQEWPTRLAAIRFGASKGGTPLTVTPITMSTEDGVTVALSQQQRLSAWKTIFPASQLVRPYQPGSYVDRGVTDFPALDAGSEIKEAFKQTARVHAYAEESLSVRMETLRGIAESWQSAALALPDDREGRTRDGSALRRAYNFYNRDTTDFVRLDADAPAPELDFHDVVTRLSDHPVLLRALGLLVDFAVPVAELTAPGAKEIRVEVGWPNPDSNPPQGWGNAVQEDVRPKTAYTMAGSRFLPLSPAPSGTQVPQGILSLAGAGLLGEGTNLRFEIVPFDVDGAALRMFSIAESERGDVAASAVETAGLPALRSMGFALVEKTRSQEHTARVNRAKARDTPAKLEGSALTAENLVAGYRIDILDKGKWYSLCRRRVRYNIGGVKIGHESGGSGILDEGYVRFDSATTGLAASSAIYIHETVARWDGWSPVIARPERVDDVSAVTPPPPSFTAQVEADKRSLPRLRFGSEYKLRVRQVDLAGGGLQPGQLGVNEEVSKPFIHRRYEPLPAPEIAPTSPYVDGAGPDLMVIRSDRGISAEAYATAHGYPPIDFRYLYAPKSSLELAMQHPGAFDKAFALNAATTEIEKQFEIAKRADKDLGAIGRLVPGANGSSDYYVVREEPQKLPWLPDFAVTNIALRCRSRPIDPCTGNPGLTQGFRSFYHTWKGEWPDRVPIALKVVGAASGCVADEASVGDQRTFTVALGPAEQVTVDIVSCPAIAHVYPWLGIAYWAGASATSSGHPVNQSVYLGKNPLVTPPRTVTMVHALQRPLSDPGGKLGAPRKMGDTHAVLDTSKFTIDVRSTGRIDLSAKWIDVQDVPPARPEEKTVVANVGSYTIAHLPLRDGALPKIRQEFADVRRRKVEYTVTAISRFRDYFKRITDQDAQACSVQAKLQEFTDVPSAARPSAPKVRYVLPTFQWSRTGEGTNVIRSSRRAGGLRVLLERPWFGSGVEEALAVVTWPVSSAPPTGKELAHLSLAGRDPLWAAKIPAAILNPTHVKALSSAKETLLELGKTVEVMISPIHVDRNFDEEAGCWFADIDLSPLAAVSYFPFVRLGLCRYQANTADPKQRLSPVVQTEPIQLFAHRDLTVTREPGKATVVVNDPNPEAPKHTTIRAELQAFAGDPRAARDGLIGSTGWATLKQAQTQLGIPQTIEVPQTPPRPLRIAVTESESSPSASGTPSRVVYADIIDL